MFSATTQEVLVPVSAKARQALWAYIHPEPPLSVGLPKPPPFLPLFSSSNRDWKEWVPGVLFLSSFAVFCLEAPPEAHSYTLV